MLNMNQTGCRMGGVAFAAGEDLSLKAGYLVKLNAGKDLVLPESDQDLAPYVVVQGADQGYLCGAVPVSSAMNCRVKLVGSCNAGELLVANGDGRVKAFTAGSQARPVGTAEETGVDGQLVLVRPLAYGLTGPAGADGAPGAQGVQGAQGPQGVPGPAGPAGADAGVIYIDLKTFPCYYMGTTPGIGKVVVKEASTGWIYSGHPCVNPDRFALVIGATDDVLTCIDLGLYNGAYRMVQGVNIPVAYITGACIADSKVYLHNDESARCILEVAADATGAVYPYPFFECVGVGPGGLASLVCQELE